MSPRARAAGGGAVKPRVEVTGIAAAKAKIRTKQREVLNAFIRDTRIAANLARDEARRTTLFADKKGLLRRSIQSKLMEKRGGAVRWKVGPDPRKAPHAALVEARPRIVTSHAKGHRTIGRVKSRPYMRQAFKATENRMEKLIIAGQKKALR